EIRQQLWSHDRQRRAPVRKQPLMKIPQRSLVPGLAQVFREQLLDLPPPNGVCDEITGAGCNGSDSRARRGAREARLTLIELRRLIVGPFAGGQLRINSRTRSAHPFPPGYEQSRVQIVAE